MLRIIALVHIATLFFVAAFALSDSPAQGDSYADSVAAQTSRYEILISEADSLYEEGRYANSAERFASAFEAIRDPAFSDLYKAACAAALAGQVGRSYGFLHRAVEAGMAILAEEVGVAILSHMDADPDLASLRAYTELWAEVRAAVWRSMQTQYGETFDPELAEVLHEIRKSDQDIRQEYMALAETHGDPIPDSLLVPLKERIDRVDSENLSRLDEIIAEHGWPGKSLVGILGANAAFLVVQHAPLEAQEHYLPLLEAAVASGEAWPSDFAMLTDRVLMENGEPQRYGSQLHKNLETGKTEFYPIEDPANVNARRAAVGLGPIEEYAQLFGIEYEASPNDR